MANDNLEEKKERLEQLKQEMAKLEAEIVAASQANEIVGEAIKQKAIEAGIDTNIPEEIPDYVGIAGEKAKALVEKGIEKGREWISRARNAINKGIHKAIETAPKVVQAVKDAPKNIDDKILEMQMAHARDKIEKKKNRKTFTSKVEDLASVIKYKIKDWKDKGKENFATNLEISKAYAKVAKDKVVDTAKDVAFYAQYGAHNVKEGIKAGKDKVVETAKDAVFYTQYGAHNVKEGIKAGKDKVVETAKDAVFYTQYGANAVKDAVKNTKDRVVKGAKGFVEKVDREIQHEQIQSAMRKIEYKGKARELFSAMKNKIKDWKDKGKEAFAKNLEISKAYMGVAKDYVKDKKDKVVENVKQLGTEAKVIGAYGKVVVDEKVGKMADAISSAAVATGTAVVEAKKTVKRNVKKASKKYTGTILSKMANGLGKAIDSAGKLRETMTTKSNQLLEIPDEQKGDENPIEHSTDDEVR